eukprot:symbB.v1.2.015688.t1/scaffold1169.1/size134116/2
MVFPNTSSWHHGAVARSAQRWQRLEGEKAVVLELQSVAKRVGLWIFCGSHFARVLGPVEGLVQSVCCESLQRLKHLRGHHVEEDLRRYEAVAGRVQAPGELRITMDVWQTENTVLFSSERSSAQLTREDGQANLILCLPSGVEEWKVLRWDFDPFGAEEEQPQPSKHHRERSPEQPRRPVWDCLLGGGRGKDGKHFS